MQKCKTNLISVGFIDPDTADKQNSKKKKTLFDFSIDIWYVVLVKNE